jgi:hypothetical protein
LKAWVITAIRTLDQPEKKEYALAKKEAKQLGISVAGLTHPFLRRYYLRQGELAKRLRRRVLSAGDGEERITGSRHRP